MNRHAQSKRVMAVLVMVSAIVGAGCGSSGETVTAEPANQSVAETSTTAQPETTVTTATAAPLDFADAVELPDFATMKPGVPYRTETEIPFLFSIAESDTASWWYVAEDDWSATFVFANPNESGELDGPQLSLAVVETGATPESVVAAMTSSAESIGYAPTDGLFGGRDAIILEGVHNDPVQPRPLRILTGDESSLEVIVVEGRIYRSHIFEEEGRVFVVSVESDPGGMPLVLAEAAQIFESLQIGDAE